MRYLLVKNWDEFQHYKDRNPPWIKLHRSLLDDYEFSRLQDASKAHLMLLWLFASQNGGKIPEDAKFLQRKLGLEKPPDLKAFTDQGLLIPEQDASNALAGREQGDSEELALARSREKRREEAEESTARFALFWAAYPRKVEKQETLAVWQRMGLGNGVFGAVMRGLQTAVASEQWKREGGKYVPHPHRWLKKRRWEDEIPGRPDDADPTLGAV